MTEHPNRRLHRAAVETRPEAEPAAGVIRGEIAELVAHRDWLYVWLLTTDFEHPEDEQASIRSEGAIDALVELAHKLGSRAEVSAGFEQGWRELRERIERRKQHGPNRLAEIRAGMEAIESELPLDGSDDRSSWVHTSRKRADRGYHELSAERTAIEKDLGIADEVLRYLCGESIQPD